MPGALAATGVRRGVAGSAGVAEAVDEGAPEGDAAAGTAAAASPVNTTSEHE